MTTVLVSFNANSKSWFKIGITSLEGSTIDVEQVAIVYNNLTRNLAILDSSPSYTDLTSQPNFVMKNGVRSLLHCNCHSQIILEKYNLSIFQHLTYKSPVWYYEKAYTKLIRRIIKLLSH